MPSVAVAGLLVAGLQEEMVGSRGLSVTYWDNAQIISKSIGLCILI